jgi:hypothetical protein
MFTRLSITTYEKGSWFHGTRQPWDNNGSREVYLTKHPDEAVGFAYGGHLGGEGERPQFHKFKVKKGGVVNIDEGIDASINEEEGSKDMLEVIEDAVTKYKKDPSVKYIEFNHPSISGKRDEFTARIALRPNEDLNKIGTWLSPMKKGMD